MSIVICENLLSGDKKKVRYVQIAVDETLVQENKGYQIHDANGFKKYGYSNKPGDHFTVIIDGVQVAKITES